MFDVVAMIPRVRRKPARLCCGKGTLQPGDLLVDVLLGRKPSLGFELQKIIQALQPHFPVHSGAL
jgi:hypothetical protein